MRNVAGVRRASWARSVIARLLAVAVVASSLVAVQAAIDPDPAAAAIAITGPVVATGTVCDGDGTMSGGWWWGLPVGSIFDNPKWGATFITRVWVPNGATLDLSSVSGMRDGNGNLAYGVREVESATSSAGGALYPLNYQGGSAATSWTSFTLPAETWSNSGAARYMDVFAFLASSLNNLSRLSWEIEIDVTGGGSFDGIDCVDTEITEHTVRNLAAKYGCQAQGVAADPVCTATGNFTYELPGLAVEARGPGLNFGLSYSSSDAATDVGVGYGWRQPYGMTLVLNMDGTRTVTQENGATVKFFPDGSGGWDAPRRMTATLEQDGSDWIFTRQHFEVFEFNSSGKLVELRDRNGETTTLSYDGSGQIDEVEDSAGRTLGFTWSSGRVDAVTDSRAGPDGGPRTLLLDYDGSGDLIGYTDAGGGAWVFTYSSHRMLTIRKPENALAGSPHPVVTNHYDGSGRIDWQEDELDRRTEFHYDDPVSGATRVVFPDGDERVDYYDAAGRRTMVKAGYGSADEVTTEFTYDPATWAPTSETVDGVTWAYQYDFAGNRTKVWAPTGGGFEEIWTATYNAFDLPLTISEPVSGNDWVTTEFDYDADGNLETIETPLLGTANVRTITFERGDVAHAGDVTEIVDERGKSTLLDYDAAGNVIRVEDPEGNETTWDYTSLGWVASVVAPKGNVGGGTPADFTTTFTYDDRGAVIEATGPAGTVEREFDGGGRLVLVRDQDSNETEYGYDEASQLLTITRPDTTVLTNEYWDDGLLRAQIDDLSGRTEYVYNAIDRLATTTDPLDRDTEYKYNARGQLISKQAPGGSCASSPGTLCTRYTYTAQGRLATINYSDSTPDVTYTYHPSGRLATMLDGQGTTTWVWDSLGRLVSEQAQGGNCGASPPTACTKYGYGDLSSYPTTINYPGNKTVTRDRDDAGRLVSITDWLSNETTFSYDENGNPEDATFPGSGNTDTNGYDDADRVLSVSMTASSSVFASLTYTRDTRGLIDSITDVGLPGSAVAYDYDANGRLTDLNATTTWGYDDADNVTQYEAPGGTMRQVFDAANQLCFAAPSGVNGGSCGSPPSGAITYTYDDRGDRTSMQDATVASPAEYAYDEESRVVGAIVPLQATNDGAYVPLAPSRILDTTTGTGTCVPSPCARLTANSSLDLTVAGTGGVPTSGVAAVVLNVVAGSPGAAGELVVFPTGSSAPTVAGLVYPITASIAGTVAVPLGTSGQVTITAVSGASDVIVDVQGYVVDSSGAVASYANPVNPARILDTRNGTGTCTPSPCAQLQANTPVEVQVAGLGGVPAGATAVAVNLIAVAGGTAGSVRAWASTDSQPSTTNLQFKASQVIGETVVVKLGTDGRIKLNASAVTHVVFDVQAWYGDTGSAYTPMTPVRILETRGSPQGPIGSCTPSPCSRFSANTTKTIAVAGQGGIPASGVTGVVAVVTSRNPSGTGYLDVYPTDATTANTSLLNYVTGQVVTNLAVAKLGPDGTIQVKANSVATDITIDVVGYMTTAIGVSTFSYAGDGLRASKTSPDGTVTRYTWDRSTSLPVLLVETVDAPGTANDKTIRYIYGPEGGVLEDITKPSGSEVARWYHRDHLGSVRALTDSTGAVLATFTYDAYGELSGSTGSATSPFGWAGEYRDTETGFVYLRARYYDPTTGVFLTRDPLSPVTGTPYAYGGNDPINMVDPTGEVWFVAAFAVGAAIGGGLDLGLQMFNNARSGCGLFHDINWGSVAKSAVIGGTTNVAGTWISSGRAAATLSRIRWADEVGAIGRAATPWGRTVQDFRLNPGGWSQVSAHAESATSAARAYRGATSIEEVFVRGDDWLVRHRVVNDAGQILHEKLRPFAKFGL